MSLLDRPRDTAPRDPAPVDTRRGLLARIGRASARRPRRTLLVWALLVLAAVPLAATLTGALSGAGWEAQGSTAQEVREEFRRDFPQLGAEAAVVVYRQDRAVVDDPAGLRRLLAALDGSPGTRSVVDPLGQPPEAGLVSPDGRTVLVPVGLEADSDADLPESAGELMDTVDAVDLPAGASADATGEWAVLPGWLDRRLPHVAFDH